MLGAGADLVENADDVAVPQLAVRSRLGDADPAAAGRSMKTSRSVAPAGTAASQSQLSGGAEAGEMNTWPVRALELAAELDVQRVRSAAGGAEEHRPGAAVGA